MFGTSYQLACDLLALSGRCYPCGMCVVDMQWMIARYGDRIALDLQYSRYRTPTYMYIWAPEFAAILPVTTAQDLSGSHLLGSGRSPWRDQRNPESRVSMPSAPRILLQVSGSRRQTSDRAFGASKTSNNTFARLDPTQILLDLTHGSMMVRLR